MSRDSATDRRWQERVRKARPLLESLLAQTRYAARVGFDPVEFPRRYRDPRDVEVSGLLAAALAYGRVDLFKPKVAQLLEQMGASPAAFVAEATPARAAKLLSGFVYRFNVGTDLGVLLLGMGAALRKRGSLEQLFLDGLQEGAGLHAALARFIERIRGGAPLDPLRRKLGPERGLQHLLPTPLGAGAAKRLNLYLRWMVRGPDAVDLGVWRSVSPSVLLIPLDTHVARVARRLRFTDRNDLSWRTAEEVTAALRLLDPEDPVRFDFALCHWGMSGACPVRPLAAHCGPCPLRAGCRVGSGAPMRRRLTAAPSPSIDAA